MNQCTRRECLFLSEAITCAQSSCLVECDAIQAKVKILKTNQTPLLNCDVVQLVCNFRDCNQQPTRVEGIASGLGQVEDNIEVLIQRLRQMSSATFRGRTMMSLFQSDSDD